MLPWLSFIRFLDLRFYGKQGEGFLKRLLTNWYEEFKSIACFFLLETSL